MEDVSPRPWHKPSAQVSAENKKRYRKSLLTSVPSGVAFESLLEEKSQKMPRLGQ
jgi:hypothetical protein